MESVSKSTQESLRELGIKKIVVTDDTDHVRIACVTPAGVHFAFSLERLKPGKGEETRVKLAYMNGEGKRDKDVEAILAKMSPEKSAS